MTHFIFKFVLIAFFIVFLEGSQGNPFEILGVNPNSTDEEVARAYRTKAKEYHPDVSTLSTEEANRRFKLIQSSFEAIQKLRRSPVKAESQSQDFKRKNEIEKETAKRTAREILEQDLKNGTFGFETLRKLPALAQKRAREGGFHFGRGPKEDGEWEAISDFLKSQQTLLLNGNLNPNQLKDLLTEIDIYTEFTGESVKDIRAGLLEPFEMSILEKTKDRNIFLETLEGRLSRMSRAGAYSLFSATPQDSKKVFGSAPEFYVKQFGPFPKPSESPELQLAKEISALAFSKTQKNPSTLYELDYLIKSVPPALTPDEKLTFLADVVKHLDALPKNKVSKGAIEDFRNRIESKIKRVFSAHPELQSAYAKKGGWWERLAGSSSTCDIILGNIARKALKP